MNLTQAAPLPFKSHRSVGLERGVIYAPAGGDAVGRSAMMVLAIWIVGDIYGGRRHMVMPPLIVILAVLALVTVKGWWPYLWREWITSVDHKRIGVMYVVLGLVMLLRGYSDAIMMRTQQAIAVGHAQGYLPPDHYDQIFSAHGTIMIFFVAMPLVIGLMNFAVPLQLGVRDVAFPVLNSVSFWLTATGALLINLSLIIGNFARTGWMGYPPLSELAFSPDVGVDYYLWSLQISGIGTLLTGISGAANAVTTNETKTPRMVLDGPNRGLPSKNRTLPSIGIA
jgi:hypothetical protein